MLCAVVFEYFCSMLGKVRTSFHNQGMDCRKFDLANNDASRRASPASTIENDRQCAEDKEVICARNNFLLGYY